MRTAPRREHDESSQEHQRPATVDGHRIHGGSGTGGCDGVAVGSRCHGSRCRVAGRRDVDQRIRRHANGEFHGQCIHQTIAGPGRIYDFPRTKRGKPRYCTLEGLCWLSDSTFVMVSDLCKAGYRKGCSKTDQSIHVFSLPG